MKRAFIPLVIAIIVMLIVAFVFTNITMLGVSAGGNDNIVVSRAFINEARHSPDRFWWKVFPFGLLIGAGIGLVVFTVGYLISPKNTKKPSATHPENYNPSSCSAPDQPDRRSEYQNGNLYN